MTNKMVVSMNSEANTGLSPYGSRAAPLFDLVNNGRQLGIVLMAAKH